MSRFFGIIIRTFMETGIQHHMPHTHAYYQEFKATYHIDTGEPLEGSLPRRQERLVEAWIEIYRDELMDNWKRIEAGEPVTKVPPLRREEG